MNKQNKMISLDSDLIEQLQKEKNASKLIEDLLKDYYGGGGTTIKQIQSQILERKNEIQKHIDAIRNMESKIEGFKLKEKKVNAIVQHIPKQIIEDFRFFKIDKEILRNRWENIYKSEYGISWAEVLEAWNTYNEEHS